MRAARASLESTVERTAARLRGNTGDLRKFREFVSRAESAHLREIVGGRKKWRSLGMTDPRYAAQFRARTSLSDSVRRSPADRSRHSGDHLNLRGRTLARFPRTTGI